MTSPFSNERYLYDGKTIIEKGKEQVTEDFYDKHATYGNYVAKSPSRTAGLIIALAAAAATGLGIYKGVTYEPAKPPVSALEDSLSPKN